jgi:hypothetical protein
MWLRSDDQLVALDVRITGDEPPGTVVAEAADVVPAVAGEIW